MAILTEFWHIIHAYTKGVVILTHMKVIKFVEKYRKYMWINFFVTERIIAIH